MVKTACIYFFSMTEMFIGSIQCAVVLRSALETRNLGFEGTVLLAAGALSFMLGLGLIMRKSLAAKSLLFFASGVAFSKVLILGGFISLPPEAQILLPKDAENIISVVYHLCAALFLLRIMEHKLH